MILERLVLENFQSFSGKHELRFRGKSPGLYLICGDNQDEPKLGGNGAGKSTIINAITWALYGKTLRGLKASNIRTWSSEETVKVSLEFVSFGVHYTLNRHWNPVRLELMRDMNKKEIVTQEELEDIIGLSYEQYSLSIAHGQFNRMFLDLSPAEKLTVFGSVLNLDRWLECSDKASTYTKTYHSKLEGLEREKAFISGRMEEIDGAIERAETKRDKNREFRAQELGKANTELESCLRTIAGFSTKLAADSVGLANIQVKRDEISGLIKEKQVAITTMVDEKKDFEREKRVLEADDKKYRDEIIRLRQMVGTCSLCYQNVPHEHIRTVVDAVQAQRKEVIALIAQVMTAINDISSAEQVERSVLEELSNQLREVTLEYNTLYTEVSSLKVNLAREESKKLYLEQKVLELCQDIVVDNEDVEAAKRNKTKFIAKLDGIKHSIEEVGRYLDTYGWWVKGFKRVRLGIINGAINRLTLDINNSLASLGLPSWTVQCSAEKETKSGTISKEFNIMVNSPSGQFPWEAWSGGETQRLRLAGAMGLANTILDFKGIKSNVEFYDEPTNFLDEEGSVMLLTALQNRAIIENKQIYIIDHRSLEFGGFSGRINVIKTQGASSLYGVDI